MQHEKEQGNRPAIKPAGCFALAESPPASPPPRGLAPSHRDTCHLRRRGCCPLSDCGDPLPARVRREGGGPAALGSQMITQEPEGPLPAPRPGVRAQPVSTCRVCPLSVSLALTLKPLRGTECVSVSASPGLPSNCISQSGLRRGIQCPSVCNASTTSVWASPTSQPTQLSVAGVVLSTGGCFAASLASSMEVTA